MIVLLLLFTIANCLILEKPDKYAGVYRHMTANFGIREGDYNITNKEIHVDYDNFHGCRLIKNAIGKLVLLMRGKCSFYKKALNVQRSGGVGMIVGNYLSIHYELDMFGTYYTYDVITRYDYVYMSAPVTRIRIKIPCILVHYGTFKMLYVLNQLHKNKILVTLNNKGDIMNDVVVIWSDLRTDIIIFFTLFGLIIFGMFLYMTCAWVDGLRDKWHLLRRLTEIKEFVWSDEIADQLSIYNSRCSICFENFDGSTSDVSQDEEVDVIIERLIKVLRCKHAFHTECINPWISQRNKCPLCKTPVVDLLETMFKRVDRALHQCYITIMNGYTYIGRLFIRVILCPCHLMNIFYEKIRRHCCRTQQ